MKEVYEAYTRRVVFRGSAEECEKWILDQGDHFGERTIYRTWIDENGDIYWDVGRVYIFNK